MNDLRKLFFGGFFLLLCAGGALAQSVQTDYDHNFDLAKFSTFGFVQVERTAEDPLTASPLNDRRIHDALNSQLLVNGLNASAQPDFWIAYYVTTKRALNIQDNRMGLLQRMGSIDVNQVTEGTLVVVFYDAATKQEVWRGYATGEITPKNLDKDVNQAAAKLVQKFKKNQRGKN